MDSAVVKTEVARIQRAYDALSLTTMTKRDILPEKWVTLAKFSLDPKSKDARAGLPVALTDFTPETLAGLRDFGASQKKNLAGNAPPKHFMFGRLPYWGMPQLVNDLRKDFVNLYKALMRPPPLWRQALCVDKFELQSGLFRLARYGQLHDDENFTNASASFIFRTDNLPTLCCDGDVYEKATPQQCEWLDAARLVNTAIDANLDAIDHLKEANLIDPLALGTVWLIALGIHEKINGEEREITGNLHASTYIKGGGKESTFGNYIPDSYIRLPGFSWLQRLMPN